MVSSSRVLHMEEHISARLSLCSLLDVTIEFLVLCFHPCHRLLNFAEFLDDYSVADITLLSTQIEPWQKNGVQTKTNVIGRYLFVFRIDPATSRTWDEPLNIAFSHNQIWNETVSKTEVHSSAIHRTDFKTLNTLFSTLFSRFSEAFWKLYNLPETAESPQKTLLLYK